MVEENARMMRQTEPYHFERNRQRLNAYPRPAQANTNQPNQKRKVSGWGSSSQDYWDGIFQDYLKGRG